MLIIVLLITFYREKEKRSSKFNAITPVAAELYAVREGLTMAVDYDIQNLELETDAQSLVTMLGTVDHSYHYELSPVINDVACPVVRFKCLIKVAHCLDQYALSMTVGHKPFTRVAYQGDIESSNFGGSYGASGGA